jgi:hypothetical protein
MRRFFSSLALLAIFILPSVDRAAVAPISPVVKDPITGFEYQLLSNADWTDSQAEAIVLGGNLVTINNSEQQLFVSEVFGGFGGTQRILWTGLHDPSQDTGGGTHASNFVWVSGSPVTYTNWDVGEPNDAGTGEFYTAMYYPGFHNPGSWNDWSNVTLDPIGIEFDGVVQFVPEPTGTLLAAALFGLISLRRRPKPVHRIPRTRPSPCPLAFPQIPGSAL